MVLREQDAKQTDGLKAIIFDFDGVLADTEPLHLRGFQTVLAEHDIQLSTDDYGRHYVGLSDTDCFQAIFTVHRRELPTPELVRLVRRKSAWMLQVMQSGDTLIPGVAEFVTRLVPQYRLAVASCALRDEIVCSLQVAGLLDAFEVIAAAEDVPTGKPNPAVYLHALKRMKSNGPLVSGACLAIEDTPLGIQAAQRAGLKCLAVATTLSSHALTMADAIVPSLSQCDFPAVVRRLWKGSDAFDVTSA